MKLLRYVLPVTTKVVFCGLCVLASGTAEAKEKVTYDELLYQSVGGPPGLLTHQNRPFRILRVIATDGKEHRNSSFVLCQDGLHVGNCSDASLTLPRSALSQVKVQRRPHYYRHLALAAAAPGAAKIACRLDSRRDCLETAAVTAVILGYSLAAAPAHWAADGLLLIPKSYVIVP